jgi:hypothetical protein
MLNPAEEMLTIQIKGRPTFDRKYQNKNLWVGFPQDAAEPSSDVYIYPHDETLARFEELRASKGLQPLQQTLAWQKEGHYSLGSPPRDLLELLEPYRVKGSASPTNASEPELSQTADQMRLERLSAFAASLRALPPAAAITGLGEGTAVAPFRAGGSPTAELEAEISNMVYEAGWVVPNFDWQNWMQNDGNRLWSEPAALASASESDLAKLLTALVREERFADGTLEEAIANGLLLAAALRAEALLDDPGRKLRSCP